MVTTLACAAFARDRQRLIRLIVVAFIGQASLVLPSVRADSPVPINKPPAYPAWWFQRDVIVRSNPANSSPNYTHGGDYPPANDYLPLTQGQLKHLAAVAFDEFEARMVGGASPDITSLVKGWFQIDPGTTNFLVDANGRRLEKVTATNSIADTNDYAPANLGQLKAVAKKFYDQLFAVHVRTAYPWTASPHPANDYAIANIGQAKAVFSFDLTVDSNLDGVPDVWGGFYNLNPGNGGGAADDTDGDGLTNAQEMMLGTDPTKKDNPAVKLTAYGFTAP